MSWLSSAARHHAEALKKELESVVVESLGEASRLLLSALVRTINEVFQHAHGSSEPSPAAAGTPAPAPPAVVTPPPKTLEDVLNETDIVL